MPKDQQTWLRLRQIYAARQAEDQKKVAYLCRLQTASALHTIFLPASSAVVPNPLPFRTLAEDPGKARSTELDFGEKLSAHWHGCPHFKKNGSVEVLLMLAAVDQPK